MAWKLPQFWWFPHSMVDTVHKDMSNQQFETILGGVEASTNRIVKNVE